MSCCPLIVCSLLFLLRPWEAMTPEILPLTLMHFELVCHSGAPLTLRTRSKTKPSGAQTCRAQHVINHPSNVLLTEDVCELNSLFRQDPRRHLCTQPLCSALPAPWAVYVCQCAAIMDTITDTITDTAVFPAALGPRHCKLTLLPHFVSAELPPPCGAFCTSERTWLLKEKYRLCSARALTKIDLCFN